MTLAEILRSHLEEPHSLFSERVNFDRAARDLERVTRRRALLPGDRLFSVGERSDELYVIESGTVNLQASIRVLQPCHIGFVEHISSVV